MPHDIFMLAYGEPNKAENWARLKATVPKHVPAPRLVEDIPGLFAAYSACARMATTPWFFVVDADNWMLDGFDFAVPVAPAADESLVWGATNPFNHLYYGHGGIKLFLAALFETPAAQADAETSLDFTATMGRNRFIDVKASEHRFNTSAYATWAAVFRECVKLAAAAATRGSLKRRAIARYRLEQWNKPAAAAPFSDWCGRGAADGIAFGREFRRDHAKLKLINDYTWMRATFRERHVRKIAIPTPGSQFDEGAAG